MPYDEYLGERIHQIMKSKKLKYHAKKMMGGLVFMVNDKMCVGIHIDKKLQHSLLMARIGETAYATEIENKHCLPMDFTGRPMRGYIFVKPEGFDLEEDLEHWVDLALVFNKELTGIG